MQKTILITGVTSGIGKALFEHLQHQGHFVIGIGRNAAKLKLLAHKSETPEQHLLLTCDLASFSAIEKTIETVKQKFKDGLDVLINNAAVVPKNKKMTEDGFEMQYQVNHLAVAKLSFGLLSLIRKKQGRIIITSSNAHKRAKFDVDDLEATGKYHPLRSYMRTKLYNIMFAMSLREKENVPVYAVHPGLVKTEIGTKDTSKLYAAIWRLFTSRGIRPEKAVSTYTYLVEAAHPEALYYYRSKPEKYLAVIDDAAARQLLWRETLKAIHKDKQSPELI